MKNPPPYKDALRPRRWLWLLVLLALGIGMAVVVMKKPSQPLNTTPAAALTVTKAVVEKADWPQTVQTSGPIAAWQEAIIGSEISGQRLIEVRVNVGDTVKKGQVLARFNPDMLLAEQAELKAEWQQAESDYQRATKLKGSGAISDQQIDSYRNQAAVAKARLDAKTLELSYTTIIAPDDGVISARTATLGAVGAVGGELFRMILQNRLEWRGELTAAQIARVEPGQTVKLIFPDGGMGEATVRQISPSLNDATRMATVYADIAAGRHAHAGMYATGTILQAPTPALFVPATSVMVRDGHNYVFKLADDPADRTKVMMQQVATGRYQGDKVEITTGLHEGEEIVTQGAGFLNDGDRVYVVSTPENAP